VDLTKYKSETVLEIPGSFLLVSKSMLKKKTIRGTDFKNLFCVKKRNYSIGNLRYVVIIKIHIS
jgi:hypothetical protein